MARFDYDTFSDGEFVANAKKYTKEETIQLYIEEFDINVEDNPFIPTVDDVKSDFCRFYNHAPEGMEYDFPDGCYTFCKESKGAFSVWVIQM